MKDISLMAEIKELLRLKNKSWFELTVNYSYSMLLGELNKSLPITIFKFSLVQGSSMCVKVVSKINFTILNGKKLRPKRLVGLFLYFKENNLLVPYPFLGPHPIRLVANGKDFLIMVLGFIIRVILIFFLMPLEIV